MACSSLASGSDITKPGEVKSSLGLRPFIFLRDSIICHWFSSGRATTGCVLWKRSPENSHPLSFSMRQMWSSLWPGVEITSKRKLSVITYSPIGSGLLGTGYPQTNLLLVRVKLKSLTYLAYGQWMSQKSCSVPLLENSICANVVFVMVSVDHYFHGFIFQKVRKLLGGVGWSGVYQKPIYKVGRDRRTRANLR
jgi:hypothetical protein